MADRKEGGIWWSVGGATARGAAHVRRDTPNQDAIGWLPRSEKTPAAALAVSDGHGSTRHFRSNFGSQFAVNAALDVLNDFLSRNVQSDATRLNASAIELPMRVHEAWRALVDRHLLANPIDGLGTTDDRLIPYGATLVAVAVSRHFALLIQLGDGDLVVGFSDGRLERPLPDDTGLVGEQTHSLADPAAARANRFRLQVLPLAGDVQPTFLMVSTDGLSKSFGDDQAFMKVAAEWRETIERNGISAGTRDLVGWLSNASQRGSGDDISLGFAVIESNTRTRKPVVVAGQLPHATLRPPNAVRWQAYLAVTSTVISVLAVLISIAAFWVATHSSATLGKPDSKKTKIIQPPPAQEPPKGPPSPAPTQKGTDESGGRNNSLEVEPKEKD